MRRILIDAMQPEEIRVALVHNQKIYDLDIESRAKKPIKSNIYKGVITTVEPSLNAAFVDYGAKRHGFLPFKEISTVYADNDQVVQKDTEVIVQVERDERGTKGASLTTFISLAGRSLVLLPNSPRKGGISRRIEGNQRDALRGIMQKIVLPEGFSVIIRTAAIDRSIEDIQHDVNSLVATWQSICVASDAKQAPCFLFQESNIIIRTIRDYFRPSIDEIIIDSPETYNLACAFVKEIMPDRLGDIKLHTADEPLYNYYPIERQIETAFEREVALQSGGSIVIDNTEALTAIDVNSAKATRGSDIEETALNTNLEAAKTIALQLRLRDLGGLFVIDFIDMLSSKHRKAVEECILKALQADQARTQVGTISNFGLLEMSRERLRSALNETTYHTCSHCDGQGKIRSVRSLALAVLRLIDEECKNDNVAELQIFASIEVCSFLLNEKRQAISDMEKCHAIRLVIVPQKNMEHPHYSIRCQSGQEIQKRTYSYQLNYDDGERKRRRHASDDENGIDTAKPAVTNIVRQVEVKSIFQSILHGLKNFFKAPASDTKTSTSTATVKPKSQSANSNKRRSRQSRRYPKKSNTPSNERLNTSTKVETDGDYNKKKRLNDKASHAKTGATKTATTSTSIKSKATHSQRTLPVRKRKKPDGALKEILNKTESSPKEVENVSPQAVAVDTVDKQVVGEAKQQPVVHRRPVNDPRNQQNTTDEE